MLLLYTFFSHTRFLSFTAATALLIKFGIGYDDEEDNARAASKRGSESDNSMDAVAPRKRRRRIMDSSDDEDASDSYQQEPAVEDYLDDDDDDEGSALSATADESPAVNATSINGNNYDSFEELSESEERRRRLGNDASDVPYLDPELYGLRRSSRKSSSRATRNKVTYAVSTLFPLFNHLRKRVKATAGRLS